MATRVSRGCPRAVNVRLTPSHSVVHGILALATSFVGPPRPPPLPLTPAVTSPLVSCVSSPLPPAGRPSRSTRFAGKVDGLRDRSGARPRRRDGGDGGWHGSVHVAGAAARRGVREARRRVGSRSGDDRVRDSGEEISRTAGVRGCRAQDVPFLSMFPLSVFPLSVCVFPLCFRVFMYTVREHVCR